MKNENEIECYFCNKPAISMEHAPAKCFYPEKSRNGKELISVPSCSLHNNDTSDDDEYARNIIVSITWNSITANSLFGDKVSKAFERKKATLNQLINPIFKLEYFENNKLQQSTAFVIDRLRIDKVIRKIAYALYYHEFKQKWNRELFVSTNSFLERNLEKNDFSTFIEAFIINEAFMPFISIVPEVFKYRFLSNNENHIQENVLRMVFYEEVEIWVNTVYGSTKSSFEVNFL